MSVFPEGSVEFIGTRNTVKQKQDTGQSPSVSSLRGVVRSRSWFVRPRVMAAKSCLSEEGKRWRRKRKNNSLNRAATVIEGMRHKRAPIVDVEHSINPLVYNRRPQVVGRLEMGEIPL